MKRIDLHDDVLLERARTGTLRASERARLAEHCRACAACALELRWIEDGVHARGPSAGDDTRGWAAVDAVLGMGLSASAPAESMRVPRARGTTSGRALAGRAVALSFLGLFVTSAAAAFFTGAAQFVETQWRALESVAAPAAQIASKARKPHRGARHADQASPGALALPAMPAALPEMLSPAQPLVPPTIPPGLAQPSELAPAVPPSSAQPPSAVHTASEGTSARLGPVAHREPERAADALLASANSARAAGDSTIAAERYTRLSHLYPGTRAELVSRVSRGNLWLARGAQPARARAAFTSYLASEPDGTLAEEAQVGLARALERLGQREDEKQAWRALLQRHPSSLYGARARARLDELAAQGER